MKQSKLLFFFLILLSFVTFAQNYKQIKIHLQDPASDVEELRKMHVPIDEVALEKGDNIVLFLSDDDYAKLSLLNLRYEILIDDWYKHYNNRPVFTEEEKAESIRKSAQLYGVTSSVYGSMGGYCTYAEVVAKLDSMRLVYPTLVSAKIDGGHTLENRVQWAVRITKDVDVPNTRPRVFYSALTHAREPQSFTTVLYYMYYLLENYNTDPEVKYLVDTRDMWFMPIQNPDGYVYNQTTNPTGGGLWRKTRKNNGDGTYGVDINRNYGPLAYWDSPNGGSSTVSSDEDYRGPSMWSEIETQNIKNFIAGKNFKVNMNYHTYSNLFIYPCGALSKVTPDSVIFFEMAKTITAWNGYSYGLANELLYPVRGGSDDFFYDGDTVANGKIISFTQEVGTSSDGFWPSQSRILPLAQENLRPNLYTAWMAGDYVKYKSFALDRQYINSGDTVAMNVVMKNFGLSVAKNLNVQLVSLAGTLTVINGSLTIDSVKARSEAASAASFKFKVNSNAVAGEYVKMALKTYSNSVLMSSDTISVMVGVPSFAFIDSTSTIGTLWTVTATPTTPKWDVTTTTFHSSPNSYTDSPSGTYSASATVTMTTTNPINLSAFTNPKLSFWTKWDIETKWDCGVVQISTDNGSTWNAATGLYTVAASGSGKQIPAGMPIYHGTKSDWVREDMALPTNAGSQVKLRFEVRTDGSINKDGWYLDDIGVYVYTAVPVELMGFSAKAVDGKVNLTWSTATETNNRGFVVERSANGITWQNVGFISGKGTTSDKNTYSFNDASPLEGKSSYRLKQTDFDGTYRIYGPVVVENSGVYSYELAQNYPNPFNPSTTINYAIAKPGNVTLNVYDITGNLVTTLASGHKEAGKYSVTFDASKLSSGVYFYELHSGSFTQRAKMLLVK